MLTVVSAIAGLATFVCAILVVIKMFQNKQTGLGIASILLCPCLIGYILALIFGWKNKDAWNLGTVMPIFTISFIIMIICNAITVPQIMKQIQDAQQQMQQQMDQNMQEPMQPGLPGAPQ